jgi:transcriptional regulator with XRE-family HTH domain
MLIKSKGQINGWKMASNPWGSQNIILQELLTTIRNDAQLTQKQLASLLGKPQSYVSKYESGERRLTLPEIREIVISCGTDLQSFVLAYEQELSLVEGEE